MTMSMPMPMTETRWWWVRHAPIEAAHAGQINGQRDVGVDLSDGPQLARLAAALPPDATWVTSALARTQATARAVGGTNFAVEAAFNEQNFGAWQGETWTALAARPEADAFWQAPGDTAPPGGEAFVDQIARVGGAMDRLSKKWAGRDVVAVAHAGTIRAALAHALGLVPGAALAFQIDTLSLTRLDHLADAGPPARRPGHWRVSGVNRTFAGLS